MSRLAGDHEKRLDSLKGDQLGIAETVGSLEKNFNSTTSVLQDRIGDAEYRLGKLQAKQEVLASNQEELKSGLVDELARLEAKIEAVKSDDHETTASATSLLRPTALSFVPTSSSSLSTGGGSGGEGSGSKNVRPAPYDGKSS